MNDFLLLFKASLKQNFRTSAKNKKISFVLIGLLLLLILFSLFMLFYGIGQLLIQTGEIKSILSLGLVSSVLMLILSLFSKSNAYLFKSKDFDFLFSLPIKKHVILLTKFVTLYIFGVLSFLLVYLPITIVYFIYTGFSLYVLIASLIISIIMPLFFISVVSLINFFLGMLISRLKFKNLLSIIGYMLLIGLGLAINLIFNNPNSMLPMIDISNLIINYVFPLKIVLSFINGSIISGLLLVFINIISIAIFLILISKNYLQIINKLSFENKGKAFENNMITTKEEPLLNVLVKREFKNYFKIPYYVINTIISPILPVVLLIVLYFQMGKIPLGQDMNFDQSLIGLLGVAMLIFFGGISPTTAVTFNLEGKEFWILKSAPIRVKTVYKAKILMNFIMLFVSSTLIAIVNLVLFKMDIKLVLLSYLLMLVVSLFVSSLGLLINLFFPKLDYDQVIKAVKQSMSLLINMLINFLITSIIVVGSVFYLKSFSNIYLYITLILIVFLLLNVIVFVIFKKIGEKLYDKIQA